MRTTGGGLRASFVLVLVAACSIGTQAQTYSVLYTFTGGADGGFPYSSVIADSAGNLYGTTSVGGKFSSTCITPAKTCGVVFRLDPAGIQTVLHSFSGTDGSSPYAGLVADGAGNFFGTTYFGGDGNCIGGSLGCGVVFRVNSAGKETVVNNLLPTEGKFPYGGLIRDSAGNFYGTTTEGGKLTGECTHYGCGVVYKLDPTRKEYTVLHRFSGPDGADPYGALVRDAAGNLYGTAQGGVNRAGVVFKIDPQGNETVLHTFTGGADGGTPLAGLIRDAAGNLYGTAIYGGDTSDTCPVTSNGCGVVFKLAPSGEETVLHTFTGGTDGWDPYAGLVMDAAGNLYGTTVYGGNTSSCPIGRWGCGVVFELAPSGEETVLYTFTGGADGSGPYASVFLTSGFLYGTASGLGSFGEGVVFKLALQ
jgi:uncharacterized repeat protein (TIGR03803 family)